MRPKTVGRTATRPKAQPEWRELARSSEGRWARGANQATRQTSQAPAGARKARRCPRSASAWSRIPDRLRLPRTHPSVRAPFRRSGKCPGRFGQFADALGRCSAPACHRRKAFQRLACAPLFGPLASWQLHVLLVLRLSRRAPPPRRIAKYYAHSPRRRERLLVSLVANIFRGLAGNALRSPARRNNRFVRRVRLSPRLYWAQRSCRKLDRVPSPLLSLLH